MDQFGNCDPCDIIRLHYDKRTRFLPEYAHLKTVIPLRHPALVAVSHKKRKEAGWLDEWLLMSEVEGFYFPMEAKPFDELEQYLGRRVNRPDTVVNSLGDYPEKQSLRAARDFLGDAWAEVETALQTKPGSLYATRVRRVRSA